MIKKYHNGKPKKESSAEIAERAAKAERERPCDQCGRRDYHAVFGSCCYAKANFDHTCFVPKEDYPRVIRRRKKDGAEPAEG